MNIHTLMHKNIAVANLEIDETTGSISKVCDLMSEAHLPVGVHVVNNTVNRSELNNWWCDRSIPASRSGIKNLLYAMHIHTPRILLTRNMGLSLSDQYWIKPEKDCLDWDDINFFNNSFSEDMGNLLFGEVKPDNSLNLCSPDNTSDGCLKKRWKIINDKRCLIKSGNNPFHQQPFNEVIASKIMDRLAISHIPYNLMWIKDEPYSVCEDFVTSDTELVSAWRVMQIRPKANHHNEYMHYAALCEENGIKDIKHSLDEMIVLDYLIANEDRHFNNFGIIRNAETLEWINAAPIFDSGSSLGFDKLTTKFYKDIGCKPFKKTHEEQIKLVASFDWIDFSKIRNAESDISDFLATPDTESFIDKERRDAIVNFIENRTQQLEKIALQNHKTFAIPSQNPMHIRYLDANQTPGAVEIPDNPAKDSSKPITDSTNPYDE